MTGDLDEEEVLQREEAPFQQGSAASCHTSDSQRTQHASQQGCFHRRWFQGHTSKQGGTQDKDGGFCNRQLDQ